MTFRMNDFFPPTAPDRPREVVASANESNANPQTQDPPGKLDTAGNHEVPKQPKKPDVAEPNKDCDPSTKPEEGDPNKDCGPKTDETTAKPNATGDLPSMEAVSGLDKECGKFYV